MSSQWIDQIGFEARPSRQARRRWQPALVLHLIASATLALSTLVAATALSIGRARAEAPLLAAAPEAGWLVLAAGMAGLGAAALAVRRRARAKGCGQ